MRMARETWGLAGICTLDLISTIWLITECGAAEANPMMARILEQGMVAFVAAKAVLVVIPLGVLEWARRRSDRFVRTVSRIGIVAYLLMYCAVVWRANASGVEARNWASLVTRAAAPVTPNELRVARIDLEATRRH